MEVDPTKPKSIKDNASIKRIKHLDLKALHDLFKLIQITPDYRTHYDDLTDQFVSICDAAGQEFEGFGSTPVQAKFKASLKAFKKLETISGKDSNALLESENKFLKNENERLRKESDQNKNKLLPLENEIGQLQKESVQNNEKMSVLKNDNDLLLKENDQNKDKLLFLEAANCHYKSELLLLESKNDSNTKEKSQKEAKILALKRDNFTLTKERDENKADKLLLTSENDQNKQTIDRLVVEIDKMKDDHKHTMEERENEIIKLKSELNNIEVTKTKLNAKENSLTDGALLYAPSIADIEDSCLYAPSLGDIDDIFSSLDEMEETSTTYGSTRKDHGHFWSGSQSMEPYNEPLYQACGNAELCPFVRKYLGLSVDGVFRNEDFLVDSELDGRTKEIKQDFHSIKRGKDNFKARNLKGVERNDCMQTRFKKRKAEYLS